MALINLPKTAILEEEKIDVKKLKSYLMSLANELEYAFSNLDEDNMSLEIRNAISSAKRAEDKVSSLISSLNLLSSKTDMGGGTLSIGSVAICFGKIAVEFSEESYTQGTATSPLNIRVSPTTASQSLGLIKQYDSFRVHSIENGWAYITYGGITGYSSTYYMTLNTVTPHENSCIITVPVPSRFSGEYTLFLSEKGNGKYLSVVNMQSADSFIATVYRDETAPKSCTVNWMAIGTRQ